MSQARLDFNLGYVGTGILAVAFITMFSTTLTCLNGYTRTLARGVTLLWGSKKHLPVRLYAWFLPALAGLSLAVIAFFLGSMRALVDLATVLAFLTAPLVAWLNFRVVRTALVPAKHRPGPLLTVLSRAGILYLAGFSLVWLYVRWLN